MDISQRTAYLVAYDVSDPRRLARTRKTILGYGVPAQLSVFRCDLTPSELVELRLALSEVINASEDQVLFADLGPADGRGAEAVTSLGRAHTKLEHKAVVI